MMSHLRSRRSVPTIDSTNIAQIIELKIPRRAEDGVRMNVRFRMTNETIQNEIAKNAEDINEYINRSGLEISNSMVSCIPS